MYLTQSQLGCLVTIIFDTYALHHILILYRGRHRDAADISHTITVQMNFNEQKRMFFPIITCLST